MKIICTKQTWCIKANDVHKRFGRINEAILNNDADLLQFAIWYASENVSSAQARVRLREIWRALIHNKTITL